MTKLIFIRFLEEDEYEYQAYFPAEKYLPDELGIIELSRNEDIEDDVTDITAKLRDNHKPFPAYAAHKSRRADVDTKAYAQGKLISKRIPMIVNKLPVWDWKDGEYGY